MQTTGDHSRSLGEECLLNYWRPGGLTVKDLRSLSRIFINVEYDIQVFRGSSICGITLWLDDENGLGP
jgi:hypothetical protein